MNVLEKCHIVIKRLKQHRKLYLRKFMTGVEKGSVMIISRGIITSESITSFPIIITKKQVLEGYA